MQHSGVLHMTLLPLHRTAPIIFSRNKARNKQRTCFLLKNET